MAGGGTAGRSKLSARLIRRKSAGCFGSWCSSRVDSFNLQLQRVQAGRRREGNTRVPSSFSVDASRIEESIRTCNFVTVSCLNVEMGSTCKISQRKQGPRSEVTAASFQQTTRWADCRDEKRLSLLEAAQNGDLGSSPCLLKL